ncbi:hypothetical protein TWF225_009398 [Orbilia oligospora]|nr:hypothetical protein TWF225_009398 [Orbilia oligospora]KAF3270043.1 hypothetical protein TWF217_008385 [Orbilia oligospora]KAF3270513.1 hypothetical protein TWF128_004274 [Orbilia oligospora]KAF3298004.1 hypothetical protein TWF132_004149 [Orbilia oligospora]
MAMPSMRNPFERRAKRVFHELRSLLSTGGPYYVNQIIMLNPEVPQKAIQAILLLLAFLPLQITAWYMQQATTQKVPYYRDGRRTSSEPAYLSQSSDEPLTFQSCITINWGNLNDNTKINFFSLARDPPAVWDPLKTADQNLIYSVRGIVFFEGAHCEPLTTRIIFRLRDTYTPQSHLFLTSTPVTPPLRLGSWRPMWLHGQDGYSDSLLKIDPGDFRLFPPPRDLERIVQRQFPLINQGLEQQWQDPVMNQQQQQQTQQNLINIESQTQQQGLPGLIHIQPGTRQQIENQRNGIPNRNQRNQGSRNRRNQRDQGSRNRGNRNQAGQIQQQRNPNPRELTFGEIIREDLGEEEEEEEEEAMSPRNARLKQLTIQVENLQRLFNNMLAERQNARNDPDPTDEIFEVQKEDYIEPSQSDDLIASPMFGGQQDPSHQPNYGDINQFFSMTNEDQGQNNYDQDFLNLERSNSGAQYLDRMFINPLSRQGSFNFQFQNPDDNLFVNTIPKSQTQEVEGGESSRIQEEPVESNQQVEPEANSQREETEENPEAQGQISEEPVQNQGTGSQAQLQENVQPQGDQPTINNQRVPETEVEMPPPRRPSQARTYPFDIGPALENNRLRYAESVNRKLLKPYLDNVGEILAGTGKTIQETLAIMAADPDIEHTDIYTAEIERLIRVRKQYLAMNDDKCLEAVINAGKKWKENNAMVIGPQGGNQHAGQQAGPQYGSLNGGLKREDV